MRSFVAFIILIVGAGVSFWIARGSSAVSEKTPLVSVDGFGKNSRQFATLNDLPLHNNPLAGDAGTNLTNDIASQYTAEILKANVRGAGKNAKIAIPNEDALNTIIRDRFAGGISVRYFESKDVKTASDNSKDAVFAYLKNIQSVYQNNISSKNNIRFLPAIAEYVENQNLDKLQSYLSSVSSQINGLLGVSAPSSFADFHLKLINAWQKRLAIGTAILQSDDDPIKAAVAVQEISSSINEENKLITALQKKLNDALNN